MGRAALLLPAPPDARGAEVLSARFPLPDGGSLAYRTQGPPGAPWMVFLNGLLSDATMWAGVLKGLRDHFRLLTFDGRGQGASESPDGPITVAQRVADTRALLQGLGIHRPWLVGLSQGSTVALELMARHPGDWRGGLLVSATPGLDFAMGLRVRHWLHCLETGGPLLQFEAAAPFLWGDAFLEKRYEVLRAYHLATLGVGRARNSPRGIRNQLLGALEGGPRARLGDITDPLLLLAGAEDLLSPPWKALAVAQAVPHARLEVIPGIGHAFPVEDPGAFVVRCLHFVRESHECAETDG
jgi:3-oxoadipate enol-lactonase